jgi:hypothetical protein
MTQLPTVEIVTLRELSVGDRFVAVSDKKRKNRYRVTGVPEYNRTHITGTRKCYNETKCQYESKSSGLKVIKLKGGNVC